MTYTVNQLAKITGITTRTLHYYDEIGLLKPSFIAENGYRYYQEKEYLALQQILFFRELQFSLQEIITIMKSPHFDTLKALKEQKAYLEEKNKYILRSIKHIELAISLLKGGEHMGLNISLLHTDDTFEQYKEEAKQRWGHTNAYKQSEERTKHWTKDDYQRIAGEWNAFNQQLADTMDKGFDSKEFQSLIAEQYKKIQFFYDCSYDMFRELGTMYATDPRFRKTYEQIKPGLADSMNAAIQYFCDKQTV